VLSGALSDGTIGLEAVRRQGGIAVVQDPSDALYPSMPTHALEEVGADFVAPARQIGQLLGELGTKETEPALRPSGEVLRQEVALMENDDSELEARHPGHPSQWP